MSSAKRFRSVVATCGLSALSVASRGPSSTRRAGRIQLSNEERESVSPLLSPLPGGAWVTDGAAPAWEVREALGLPPDESPAYNTVAGFVIHALGAIPRPGASVVADGFRWTVVDVEGPRVTRVKIERESR